MINTTIPLRILQTINIDTDIIIITLKKRLIVFLNKVSKYSEQNKMDLTNLGTVFGPALLQPKEETPEQMLRHMQGVQTVIMTLLLSYPSIFEVKFFFFNLKFIFLLNLNNYKGLAG